MRGAVLMLAALVTASSAIGAQAPRPRNPQVVSDVSLMQLIATPERFNGRPVRVIGFCWLEFEGNSLYLHREDFDQGITRNAVWLDLGSPVPARYMELKGKYVVVEGTFSSSERGHFGMFGGSIKAIRRLEDWRGRPDPTPPKKP
jgi:hypothetical protein